MGIHLNARFVTSSPDVGQCPPPRLPEYAFIGRSNVGKSSLINMLTGQKMLAKTSGTPGKTQLINHFIINEEWYLVDLPGYGYARTAKSVKKNWVTIIEKYLLNRTSLMSTFLLIDARLELQDIDRRIINWFGEHQLPFTIIFTKTDKLKPVQLASNLESVKKEMLKDWEELPAFIITSSKSGMGREEILSFIQATNVLYKPV